MAEQTPFSSYMRIEMQFTDRKASPCKVRLIVMHNGARYITFGDGPNWAVALQNAKNHMKVKSGLPGWYLDLEAESADIQEPLL